jgi:hypothetical protein
MIEIENAAANWDGGGASPVDRLNGDRVIDNGRACISQYNVERYRHV